ncbi:MAG: adenylate/guanylate cyclase domain-containing protein, partial [Candidatus Muiribacteriaceae bacterium]
MPSQLLTIMFTDIVDFTSKTENMERSELRDLLTRHEEILHPVVDRFKGRIIKTIGDALLVTFKSPTNAVLCAMMMQYTIYEKNTRLPEEKRFNIRIALNSGEVEIRGNDVFGPAVNLASRLEGITDADEIFITENVYMSMQNRNISVEEHGEHKFKGVSDKVRVYRVIQDLRSQDYHIMMKNLKFDKEYHTKTVKDRQKKKSEQNISSNKQSFLEQNSLQLIILLFFAVLFAAGFWFFQRSTPDRAFSGFTQALQNDDHVKAEKELVKMYSLHSQDQLTAKAAQDYLRSRADSFIEEKDFEEAFSFFRSFRKRFPWVDMQDAIITTRLAFIKKLVEDRSVPTAIHEMKRLYGQYSNVPEVVETAEYYSPFFEQWSNNQKSLKMAAGKTGFQQSPEQKKIQYDKISAESIRNQKLSGLTKGQENDINEIKIESVKDKKQKTQDKNQVAEKIEEKVIAETVEEEGSVTEISEKSLITKMLEQYKDSVVFSFSEKSDQRQNQYERLEEHGELHPLNKVRYYFDELFYLGPTHTQRLQKAVDILERLSEDPAFSELIAHLEIEKTPTIRCLSYWSDISDKVRGFISRNLYAQFRDRLEIWMEQSDDITLRYYAYKILRE